MMVRNVITVGLNPAIDYVVRCAGFLPGRVNSGRLVARMAAGKAANVTRALALLGQDVLAYGFLGEGDWPFFKDQLHKLRPGAVVGHFSLFPQATRQNITILHGETETHIRLAGFEVNKTDITALEKDLKETVQPGDAVLFCGSLPQGLSAQQFGDLLDIALSVGAKVGVDTAGEALTLAMRRPLWIAKPNAEELAEAWGTGKLETVADITAAAGKQACQVENLLVSRGQLGALLIRQGECVTGSISVSEPVIRTVACGDHLLAGFVHGLAQGKSPMQALGIGLALATARAVSADLEIFDSVKYSTFLKRVVVARV